MKNGRIFLAASVLLSLAIGLSGCGMAAETTQDSYISTQLVKQGDLQIGVYADGRVSIPMTGINFSVPGTLAAIHVSSGQTVAAGDLLAELDTTDLQSAVDAAQSGLQRAQASYDDAVRTREYNLAVEKIKLDSLYEEYQDTGRDAAEEAYELQKLKYENMSASTLSVLNAELNLAEAEKKYNQAAADLEQTRLYSPVAGQVIDIAYMVGDEVPAKSSTASSVNFLTLYDPQRIQVVANVSESDISGLQTGMAIRVSVDALFIDNQPGQIIEVDVLPKIDNTGIVSYAVTGLLEQPDQRILDGMSVFVLFLIKEKPDVLLVSNKAIFIEDGKQYVHVQQDDGTLAKRAVICGLSNGTVSEVIEGLTAGEKVVTGGIDR